MVIIGVFWYFYGTTLQDEGINATYNDIRDDIFTLTDKPFVTSTIDTVQQGIERLMDAFTADSELSPNKTDSQTERGQPLLESPTEQSFSIYNIEIGDSRTTVEEELGSPKRSSLNEYGVEWVSYHRDYHNFMMVAYDQSNHVAGLYTNQALLRSTNDLTFDNTMEEVLDTLDEPLSSIQKGSVNYMIESDNQYDTFFIDDNYITFFYDIHENHSITAVQIISKSLEKQKKEYFAESSKVLKQGLEQQLFDLTNATRIVHGLNPLTWDDAAHKTTRNHSSDMADNDYFSHTNLAGESPFDRLQADGITFHIAGENLATGQPSSIYAHEGLMNSLGHRENILKEEYKFLAVGVAFNQTNQPFYTENFLTK